jgi:hypothetical protein
VRVNVIEPNRAVSFVIDDEALPRLLAACSAEPSSLNELLAAADAFQQGIARQVVDGLMAFDRLRANDEDIRGLLETEPGLTLETSAPDVIEMLRSGAVTVDLRAKALDLPPGLEISESGQVRVHDGTEVTRRSITHQLPSSWTLRRI